MAACTYWRVFLLEVGFLRWTLMIFISKLFGPSVYEAGLYEPARLPGEQAHQHPWGAVGALQALPSRSVSFP